MGRDALFDGQGGQRSGGLPHAHHHGLQACGSVHLPGGGHGLVGHQQVVCMEGDYYAQGYAEGGNLPKPEVFQILMAGMLLVVMVHGIVSHGHRPGVEVIAVGLLGGLHGHGVPPGYPPGIPEVGEEGKAVLCGIDIIGQADMAEPQLRLQVVDEAQGAEFGLLEGQVPFLRGHVYVLDPDVVAALGPVEHVMPVRKLPVIEHHFLVPGVAAAAVIGGVVSFRFYGRHGLLVFLHNGHIGHVLGGHAVLELLCAHHLGHVSQLGSVYEDAGLHPAAVGEGEVPGGDARSGIFQPRFHPQLHSGLIGHIAEHLRPHGGVEEDVAHPAAFEILVAAVAKGQGVREFPEEATPQAVIAVNGAYPGAGEHAAQPGRRFHHQHFGAAAGRLDGRRGAAGAAAHNHHVVLGRTGQQHERQACTQKPFSHISSSILQFLPGSFRWCPAHICT